METVAIDTRLDGRLAVLVRPAAAGPWPGVVMVHEAWGLDDVLRRQADFRYRLERPFVQWDTTVVPTERERSSWL